MRKDLVCMWSPSRSVVAEALKKLKYLKTTSVPMSVTMLVNNSRRRRRALVDAVMPRAVRKSIDEIAISSGTNVGFQRA